MERILFITGNLIGDVMLSTGVLAHLAERHPRARFTIACGKAAGGLFARFPQLERVVTFEKRRKDRHWFALWRELRDKRFDLSVDLRGSLLTYFLSSGRRRILRARAGAHASDDVAGVVDLAKSPPPKVWLSSTERAWAAGVAPADRPLIALAPGASWPGKRWPAERFAELARALTDDGGPLPGARIALVGGPGEEAMAAEVAGPLADLAPIDLVGRASLLENAALFERTRLFVGNDSGLMHVAAAAGAPTLGLFGPTDARRYAPRTPFAAVARTTRDFGPVPPKPTTAPDATGLMDTLSVEAATAAARDLLDRSATWRPPST